MHAHRPPVSKQVLWSAVLATALGLIAAPLTPVYAAANTATVVGAFPAPPKGPGTGRVVKWRVGSDKSVEGHFGTAKTLSGNSFYIAYDNRRDQLYVPTVAGTTYVLNAQTLKPVTHFKTLPGGRVARVSANHKAVLVLSGKAMTVYSLSDYTPWFTVPVGGNALAIGKGGRHVYIGGNMSKEVTEISLHTGKITHRYPIAGAGDLVWANGKLFAVNMKSGVMSMLNPATGKIVRTRTDETDPTFSYKHIPAATAGFMQLAVSPDQRYLYAAGFSGNISKFSTRDGRYLGKIAVKAAPSGPNKLSGIVIVDHGKEAVVTVENRKEAALVRLSDAKIIKLLPGTMSNRWIKLQH